jgi:HAD domain in Swiss Army Knife RNA repair proteins
MIRLKNGEKKEHPLDEFCPELVSNLNDVTDKTGAKIVLSSTWRKGQSIEELRILFKLVGIKGELIDITPVLHFSNWSHSVPRGCEIQKWIEDNKGILGTNLLSWKDYVIIDDDGDMLYWHRKNFYQTDRTIGLSPNLAYKIINFLK